MSSDTPDSNRDTARPPRKRTRSKRQTEGPDASIAPGDSLSGLSPDVALGDLAKLQTRRFTFVVLFRIVLITLVLGITTLLYWLADTDLTTPSALTVFAVIGVTYLLTIAYSLKIRAGQSTDRLATLQMVADLAIASIIVHATGGAQSAYTFFFPLAIIGAALLTGRRTMISISAAALALFLVVSTLGWLGWIPVLSGQEVRPDGLTGLELTRALALNGAAIFGVGLLAVNLGSQLLQTRTSLASQSSAAADLRTLHSDIVRSLASGLITVDTAGRINSINRAARRILDIDSSSAVGRSLDRLIPGLAGDAENPALVKIHRAEVAVERPTGDVILGVSVSPLFDRNHLPIGRVVNFQDLTELREIQNQVRRSERLAVIGRLAAGVAHEIRNPLASISGSIELLRQSPAEPSATAHEDDDNQTLMNIVTREIDRLNLLITELLDYTNPSPITRVEIDLSVLLKDTTMAFTNDPDVAELEIEFEATSDPVWVVGDGEKLRQVFWNLLRNAADAARSGGDRVSIRVENTDTGGRVEVEDNGPGISPEGLERIFEPFFTTKKGGTGLGLAIVYSIVDEHGGTITPMSTPGLRTVFRVDLPSTVKHKL